MNINNMNSVLAFIILLSPPREFSKNNVLAVLTLDNMQADILDSVVQRRAALQRKQAERNQRYLVRFLEDDSYAIAERGRIVDTDDAQLTAGNTVKVVYDKSLNSIYEAIILHIGSADTVAVLESRLLASGRDGEQDILASVGESELVASPKQHNAHSRPAVTHKRCSEKVATARASKVQKMRPDTDNVHLSPGNANADPFDFGDGESNNAIGTAMRALSAISPIPYCWDDAAQANSTALTREPVASRHLFADVEDANAADDDVPRKHTHFRR
jgi:hypothetical protein